MCTRRMFIIDQFIRKYIKNTITIKMTLKFIFFRLKPSRTVLRAIPHNCRLAHAKQKHKHRTRNERRRAGEHEKYCAEPHAHTLKAKLTSRTLAYSLRAWQPFFPFFTLDLSVWYSIGIEILNDMWNDFFHQTQDNTVDLYKFSRLLLTKQEIRLNSSTA